MRDIHIFMSNIKAIQTRYKGYHFRSRLEARYAIFFDHLGIKWEYELEGYEINNKDGYLPDFYLTEFDIFAEVKPVALSEEELKNAMSIKEGCILFEGSPSVRFYNIASEYSIGSLGMVNALSPIYQSNDIKEQENLKNDKNYDYTKYIDKYESLVYTLQNHFLRTKGVVYEPSYAAYLCGLSHATKFNEDYLIPSEYIYNYRSFKNIPGEWIRESNSSYVGYDPLYFSIDLISSIYKKRLWYSFGEPLETDGRFVSAVVAARSARFEHGESGAT
jgi:hypothetical protein